MKKEKFDVTGMTCSSCSSHVEKSVSKLDGVDNVSVNLLTNSMQVTYEEERLDTGAIINAVEHAGYGAAVKAGTGSGAGAAGQANGIGGTALRQKPAGNAGSTGSQASDGSAEDIARQNIKAMKKRLIVSVVFLIPLMYVSMGHMVFGWLNIEIPPITMKYLHGNENAITYAFTQLLLLIPILAVNRKYFTNGFKTLARRSPNMDSLIAIGAGAAIAYGVFAIYRIGYGLGHGDLAVVQQYSHDLYFESAGTILALITVGKYLETKSKGRTSEAITRLMNLAPKTITVIRDGSEEIIDVQEVAVGDLFLVKPGESVAVDGIIEEGKSSFDESAITGESIPVLKQEGDKIVSASINKAGLIRARAEKVGEDTTIAQIIRLVEEASSSKAPIARMADKIAGVFVPAVIGIAVITFVVWLIAGGSFEFAMSSAIAVLVISCPCALGLATPVAIMVGTGKGAENGILIKSGEALETAHLIDTVVLDKTGTITQGRPVVTDIDSFNGILQDKLLQIAGSLEKGSEHPLAEAIVSYCRNKNIEVIKVNNFQAEFGKGIQGELPIAVAAGEEGKASNNHHLRLYYAGNEKMMEEKGISISHEIKDKIHTLAKQGKTPLIFADESRIIGIISVADVVKPTSREAVRRFREYGIHVIMLTGDNEVTASAIKDQVGIDEVIAGVLPTQKEEKISALKNSGHKVAMIGDGINDAPALASADVGIAIGAGTDVAIESADIVLMKNDLLDAVGAVKLSKSVIRNIKENLFWAFFYNIIGIPLAAGILYPFFGMKLNPMFAAAAMSLSSICVVANALRLKTVRLGTGRSEASSDISSIQEAEASNKQKRKEKEKMKKTIMIEGMSCGHCSGRVESALKELAGVTEVTVSLEEKNAVVTADESVTDDMLKKAVTDAGYEVTGVN